MRGKAKADDPLLKKEIDPNTCPHPNLKFERHGAILGCIDCDLHWFVAKGVLNPSDGSFAYISPDFNYGNAKVMDGDTRHSRYEMQRTAKK